MHLSHIKFSYVSGHFLRTSLETVRTKDMNVSKSRLYIFPSDSKCATLYVTEMSQGEVLGLSDSTLLTPALFPRPSAFGVKSFLQAEMLIITELLSAA